MGDPAIESKATALAIELAKPGVRPEVRAAADAWAKQNNVSFDVKPSAPVPPLPVSATAKAPAAPPPPTATAPAAAPPKRSVADAIKAAAGTGVTQPEPFVRGHRLATSGRGRDAPLDAPSQRLATRPETSVPDAARTALEDQFTFGNASRGRAYDVSHGTRISDLMSDQPAGPRPSYDDALAEDRAHVEDVGIDHPVLDPAMRVIGGAPAAAVLGPAIKGASYLQALLSNGVFGGILGGADALGHTDRMADVPGNVARGVGTGMVAGAGGAAVLEPLMSGGRALGEKVWQNRLGGTGGAVPELASNIREGAEVGMQPDFFSRGGVGPAPGSPLEALIKQSGGRIDKVAHVARGDMESAVDDELMSLATEGGMSVPGESAAGAAERRMGQAVDTDLNMRAGGGTPGIDPSMVEADQAALALRRANDDNVMSSVNQQKTADQYAMDAAGDERVNLQSEVDTARKIADEKYVQKGGFPADPEQVAQKKILQDAADEARNSPATEVEEDLFSEATDLEKLRADQKGPEADPADELQSAADGIDTEPQDAPLLYSPRKELLKIADEHPIEMDAQHLQQQIRDVEEQLSFAKAKKAPGQTELMAHLDRLLKARKKAFPDLDKSAQGAHARMTEMEAERAGAGISQELHDLQHDFGKDIDSLTARVLDPSPNAERSIASMLKKHPRGAEIMELVKRARETKSIEAEGKGMNAAGEAARAKLGTEPKRLADLTRKIQALYEEGRSLDDAGDAARAQIGPRSAKAGKLARGARGFEKARNESIPFGFGLGKTVVEGSYHRLAALKKMPPPTTLPGIAATLPPDERKEH